MHRATRVLSALSLATGLLAAVASPAAQAADLTEYRAGLTPDSHPSGIARGADGNVWFAELADPGRIARITPSGVITEFSAGVTPNSGPRSITPGPDGNLWFTETKRAAIGRITPSGAVTEFTAGISPGSEPQEIVAAPDGNLWFTERAGRIGRITPSGVVTEFSAGMPAGAQPQGITVGADGSLWFTDASAAAAIGQITIGGTITVFDAAVPAGSAPYDITAGADGNLWFTLPGSSQIGRMTPGGAVTLFSGMRANAEPMGIALGPDKRAWFTERNGGRIAAVDTSGSIEEFPSGFSGRVDPTDITPGPGGTVWFTEAAAGGAIGVYTGAGDPTSPAGLPGATPGLPGGDAISGPGGASGSGDDTGSSGGQTAAGVTNAIAQLLGGAAQGDDWSLPTQGKTFLVAPVTGEVYARAPKSGRSPRLTGLKNIPMRSRIDAARGVMVFVAALPNKRYQIATFKDGRFDVTQKAKGNGMTDLVLRGKTGCGGNGEPDPMLASASARKAKPTGRRLWASDNKGRFRTHGRDSVATVRGTEWITEDTCEGTLTTVVKGAVSVRNTHTGRKKLVKAGHSYLVRRKR